MLLMAGLMLADKTAGVQDKLREAEDKMAEKEAELDQLRNAPQPEPERVEVAVIPDRVTESLAEIAARAESLADQIER
jgi:cell division protein ZapA